MNSIHSHEMMRFTTAMCALLAFGNAQWVFAQGDPSKAYETCKHWELIEQIRAYEDTLAFEASAPDTLRGEYGQQVRDLNETLKSYRLYRCAALLDTIAALQAEVDFAQADPPVVDTDSISAITGSSATFHAKVTSDGGLPVSNQWFRYGTSSTSLTDSVAVSGTATPFSKNVTALSAGQYYVAGFANNAKGTSSGDTLSFWIPVAPTLDTDSTSVLTATSVTLHAKVTSNGNGTISAQWFRYGLTAASLTDSVAVVGTSTSFTAALTGLDPATRYYFAAFAENAAGSATGDTLSFLTRCSVDSVLHQSYYYGVIQAETQCWFDENLRTAVYNNNDSIPAGFTNAQWGALTTAGRSEPSGSEANVATYGRLYNWYAVSDSRGLCPSGWHVPSEDGLDSLFVFLGGDAVAGGKLKAAAPDWNGTDDIGFRVLQAGGRTAAGAFFTTNAGFWTSTVDSATQSVRVFFSDSSTAAVVAAQNKKLGLSVRCLQD